MQAKKDVPEHAIYAASFKKGGQHFPLVWAMGNKNVPAENVTDRYAQAAAPDAKAETAKSTSAIKELRAALDAKPAALAELADKSFAKIPLTKEDAATARELLWKAHAALIQKDRAGEVKDLLIKDGKLEMPFFYKTFGKKPEGGRSLYISLHGGGGARRPSTTGSGRTRRSSTPWRRASTSRRARRRTPGTCGTRGTSTACSPG